MNEFQEKLKGKMDNYVHHIYQATRKFPKDELYGVTSQIRRASLSVILNYVEGFARRRKAVRNNFWEIFYGSLIESKYLLDFCLKEAYLAECDYKILKALAEEIGAMLYHSLKI